MARRRRRRRVKARLTPRLGPRRRCRRDLETRHTLREPVRRRATTPLPAERAARRRRFLREGAQQLLRYDRDVVHSDDVVVVTRRRQPLRSAPDSNERLSLGVTSPCAQVSAVSASSSSSTFIRHQSRAHQSDAQNSLRLSSNCSNRSAAAPRG